MEKKRVWILTHPPCLSGCPDRVPPTRLGREERGHPYRSWARCWTPRCWWCRGHPRTGSRSWTWGWSRSRCTTPARPPPPPSPPTAPRVSIPRSLFAGFFSLSISPQIFAPCFLKPFANRSSASSPTRTPKFRSCGLVTLRLRAHLQVGPYGRQHLDPLGGGARGDWSACWRSGSAYVNLPDRFGSDQGKIK